MGLIYITGVAGSGKSAICKTLLELGHEAHEGDDTLSAFYNNVSGKKVNRPLLAADRTPKWRSEHTWKMSRDGLLELKERAQSKPIFVCGVASNEDEYIDVFDRVFALVIDENTLIERIKNRGSEGFGQSPHELKTLMEWQRSSKDYYKKIGAHTIDATRPIEQVAKALIAAI
ncbi:MAG: hypothetical protein KIH63_001015 [Candidatus Saccharibacteria bacterium]|nr:hypothetical protein [Candidatus Saccharibacteria bacterium]